MAITQITQIESHADIVLVCNKKISDNKIKIGKAAEAVEQAEKKFKEFSESYFEGDMDISAEMNEVLEELRYWRNLETDLIIRGMKAVCFLAAIENQMIRNAKILTDILSDQPSGEVEVVEESTEEVKEQPQVWEKEVVEHIEDAEDGECHPSEMAAERNLNNPQKIPRYIDDSEPHAIEEPPQPPRHLDYNRV